MDGEVFLEAAVIRSMTTTETSMHVSTETAQLSDSEFLCPGCGARLSGEADLLRGQVGAPMGGAYYDELKLIACARCHKVLGVVR